MFLTSKLICLKFSSFTSTRRLLFTASQALCSENKFKFEDSPSRIEARLRSEDKVPDSFRLIYRAPMKNYVLSNQVFSTFSAFTSVSLISYKLIESFSLGLTFYEVARLEDTTPLELYSVVFFTSFFIISTIMLSTSYPLRIYKNDDSQRFQYVKYAYLPFATKKYEILAGQVKPKKTKVLPHNCVFKDTANNNSLVILPQYFRSPEDCKDFTGVKFQDGGNN